MICTLCKKEGSMQKVTRYTATGLLETVEQPTVRWRVCLECDAEGEWCEGCTQAHRCKKAKREKWQASPIGAAAAAPMAKKGRRAKANG